MHFITIIKKHYLIICTSPKKLLIPINVLDISDATLTTNMDMVQSNLCGPSSLLSIQQLRINKVRLKDYNLTKRPPLPHEKV